MTAAEVKIGRYYAANSLVGESPSEQHQRRTLLGSMTWTSRMERANTCTAESG